jgi:cysteine-rich CPCC protein
MGKKRFACQCCGFLTLEEDPNGSYEICEVCFWENNYVQFRDPNWIGANKVSLNEARANFLQFGAKDERSKSFVRPPLPEEHV